MKELEFIKGRNQYLYSKNKKYLDFCMSNGAMILGHSNKEVNSSVINQIKKGSTLSLTTRLEGDLSELLVKNIPPFPAQLITCDP